MNKDTLQIVLSDFHSGSNYALFLEREWQGRETTKINAKSDQIEIRKHFNVFADIVAKKRQNKRVRVIVNGDSIDGDHHNSGDVCTNNILEQSKIHIEIMEDFKSRIKWQRGDELYYTRGTEVHTSNMEEHIAQELGAVPNGVFHAFDYLELDTNGRLSIFVHHGPGAGEGSNEGNQMRNWLRNISIDAMKDGRRIADIVYTGHVHNPTYSPYGYRRKMKFFVMHGVITPSWQLKTRYAHMKAPVSVNKIGGVIHEIKADGTVCVPDFYVMGYME